MSAALIELRQLVEAVIETDRPEQAISTGVAALDAVLASRGIPRGRMTEVIGERGGGKTTLVRGIVARAMERGEWVAYVDASRTLAPRDWAILSELHDNGLWMVRPRAAARAAWSADVLLRSGAFGLVVIDGAPPLSRSAAVRLTRLARDAGAALVVTADGNGSATHVAGALRLRVARTRESERKRRPTTIGTRQPPPGARVMITVEKGGNRRTVEVMYECSVARRLCAHPEVPDRRGVERAGTKTSERSGAEAVPARSPLAPPAAIIVSRVAPRSRRCAEPDAFDERTPRPQRIIGASHQRAGAGVG